MCFASFSEEGDYSVYQYIRWSKTSGYQEKLRTPRQENITFFLGLSLQSTFRKSVLEIGGKQSTCKYWTGMVNCWGVWPDIGWPHTGWGFHTSSLLNHLGRKDIWRWLNSLGLFLPSLSTASVNSQNLTPNNPQAQGAQLDASDLSWSHEHWGGKGQQAKAPKCPLFLIFILATN